MSNQGYSTVFRGFVVSSFFFPCISDFRRIHQITVLITTVIRLPVGTLGDIYTPVNTQIAVSRGAHLFQFTMSDTISDDQGMYPIVVLLLVSHGKTLENSAFPRGTTNANPGASDAPGPRIEDGHAPLESMRFRRATINSESYSRHVISEGQISEALRSPREYCVSPKSTNVSQSHGSDKFDARQRMKNMGSVVE